jgi:hypothetical protein
MSCKKQNRAHAFGFFMFCLVMLLSISFVTFIEYCPLGISLWGQLGEMVNGYVRL